MPLIDEGHAAPDFELADQTGTTHRLADCRGKAVVLYFYPKDDTSGCTKEACQFRDQLPDFESANAVVYGVSPDDVQSHEAFAEKLSLNFPLLADSEGTPDDQGKRTPPVCEAYGAWGEKSMYGNTYMGVIRTTYLIDAEGNVARRWDKVKVPGHAKAVRKAIDELHVAG